MSRDKIPLLPLSQLRPEQLADCFALLAEKTRSQTRDGKPCYFCRFQDSRRAVRVSLWGDSKHFAECEANWKEGEFFKLRGVYIEDEKYGPQLELHQVRKVKDSDRKEGFDPAQLVESSRFDPEGMFRELRGLATVEITDAPLRKLVHLLLDRHAEKIKRLPASQNRHYPYAGGLVEHLLAVTQTCIHLVDRYQPAYPDLKPPLNRNLVIAGAILHDIGRVAEFEDELARQPSIEGKLAGHLILGRDMIRAGAAEVPELNPELVKLLEHIVLTHLSLPEWGSPRLPLIPECLIVHHADDLDAKLEMFARCLTRDQNPGPFTDREPSLNRQLLKGRSV